MGDVAMTVPVIKALSSQYDDIEITMITGKLFNPFFLGINNLKIINPELTGKHKGLSGLFKLYRQIKKEVKPDVVIDIHDVLRTKILRTFFILTGIKSVKIDKGRKEKKQLTRKKNKDLTKLKHTIQRYSETFLKAGINIEINKESQFQKFEPNQKESYLLKGNSKKIGIAPFSKHPQKQYPIEMTEKVIQILARKKYEIFIFGGGKNEKRIAENIENSCKNVSSLVGKFSLQEEIFGIDQMDIMISMDSANMHIAALTKTKIVSIWGATHPFAGFTPFVPKERLFIIQNEDLTCRPCSVYGNKKCFKGTLECMTSIEPEKIIEACESFLNDPF